jgi:hypothetical protein
MSALPARSTTVRLSASVLPAESDQIRPTPARRSIGGAHGPQAIQHVMSIAWATVHSLVLLAVALALILGVLPAALIAAGTWVAQAP